VPLRTVYTNRRRAAKTRESRIGGGRGRMGFAIDHERPGGERAPGGTALAIRRASAARCPPAAAAAAQRARPLAPA